jgi:hypothetical protein
VEKYGIATQATDEITGRMRFACFISNATSTHKIRNAHCFPIQQCLRERASMLGSYAHCLFCYWTLITAAYQYSTADVSVVVRVPQPEQLWSTELPGQHTPSSLHTISLPLNLSAPIS